MVARAWPWVGVDRHQWHGWSPMGADGQGNYGRMATAVDRHYRHPIIAIIDRCIARRLHRIHCRK